jgi:23S rRNA-/tRNA-specific pseudouridylate synthase
MPKFQTFLDDGKRTIADRSETIALLRQEWTTDKEYGLLNRLDEPTGGFLTFATNQPAKDDFVELQRE